MSLLPIDAHEVFATFWEGGYIGVVKNFGGGYTFLVFYTFCCSQGACGYKINGLLKLSNDQSDASKSNESKAQQTPAKQLLIPNIRMMTL